MVVVIWGFKGISAIFFFIFVRRIFIDRILIILRLVFVIVIVEGKLRFRVVE